MRDLRMSYRIDTLAGTLKSLSGRESYKLGESVQVRVTKADKTLRRLDFEIVK